MNNTLCLGIFAALVGIRGLTWQYSAEVTVILLVLFIMGAKALFFGFINNHTYPVSYISCVQLAYYSLLFLLACFRISCCLPILQLYSDDMDA